MSAGPAAPANHPLCFDGTNLISEVCAPAENIRAPDVPAGLQEPELPLG